MMLRLIAMSLMCFHLGTIAFAQEAPTTNQSNKKIAFSFDDGDTSSYAQYVLEKWNEQILKTLEKHQVKAILYATGKNLMNSKGNYILTSWSNSGHYIANHSFAHKNYSHPKAIFSWFKEDFLKNDSLINQYATFIKYYRFPYLKEGNTREKIDSARQLFKEMGYKNGYVTIDASDWYINQRLLSNIKKNPAVDLESYENYYIEHLYNRAMFYDSLAYQLTQRNIPHTLLLHHNLATSLFLDDVIEYFQSKGWEIIDAHEALNDEIYLYQSSVVPCGESIIWSMAKEQKIFDNVLRYPAEDAIYEKEKMDQLGL